MSIKSSIKSLEGQSLVGMGIAAVGALYMFIGGDNLPELSVEQVLMHAESVQDIKDAYANDNTVQSATGFAKISAVLFFMYKIHSNFLGKRTELKKKEIEINEKIVTENDPGAVYPNGPSIS